MKKVKLLLPVWLILLYFGSIAYMLQIRTENNNTYREWIEKARSYAENDVIIDAISAYKAALEIYPDADLALEAGEVYLDHEVYSEAENWYRNILYSSYPDKLQTYDYGIRLYLAQDNYRQAFAVYDECKSRQLITEDIETLMVPVLYSFDLSGRYEDVQPFSNISKVAAVQYDGYWGYIAADGDRVLDYVYLSAGMLNDIGAVVDKEGKAYFIDSYGNKKITDKLVLEHDPELGRVECFLGVESGKFWAYNGEYWNCYDAESCEKLYGGYTAITNITNNVGAVRNQDLKWALIAADGTLLTDYLYDEVVTDQKKVFCRTDAVFVKNKDRYFMLNKEGKTVGNDTYEEVCAFYDTTYAAVKNNGQWYYVDQSGMLCDIGKYEQAESFSNGLAAVCKAGKWGYIDLKGNLVIDYQFDAAGPFSSSGVAFVKTEGESTWNMLSLYRENHEL